MSADTGKTVVVRDVARTATELKAEGKDLKQFPTTPHGWAFIMEKWCKHLHGKFGEMAAAKTERDPDGEQLTRAEVEPIVMGELEKGRAEHDAEVAAKDDLYGNRPDDSVTEEFWAGEDEVACSDQGCGYRFTPMSCNALRKVGRTGELKKITRRTEDGTEEVRRRGQFYVDKVEREVFVLCSKHGKAVEQAAMRQIEAEAREFASKGKFKDVLARNEFINDRKATFFKMNLRTCGDAHKVVAGMERVAAEKQELADTATKLAARTMGTASGPRGWTELNRQGRRR